MAVTIYPFNGRNPTSVTYRSRCKLMDEFKGE